MAFIDQSYVDNAIGSTVRARVAPTTAAFDQYEAAARMKVRAAAKMAGYTLPNTSASDQIRELALGQWVLIAYGQQKGLTVPDAIVDTINMLELVRRGDMPLLDYDADVGDGIGGVRYTSTDQDEGRPQRFSRSELKGW